MSVCNDKKNMHLMFYFSSGQLEGVTSAATRTWFLTSFPPIVGMHNQEGTTTEKLQPNNFTTTPAVSLSFSASYYTRPLFF